jgi:hypothetical protein
MARLSRARPHPPAEPVHIVVLLWRPAGIRPAGAAFLGTSRADYQRLFFHKIVIAAIDNAFPPPRRKWRKTAIPQLVATRESREVLGFRDVFLRDSKSVPFGHEKTRRAAPGGSNFEP